MFNVTPLFRPWLGVQAGAAQVIAPCDGLVVEVAAGLKSASLDRVVVRIQSSESGEILSALAPSRPSEDSRAARGSVRVEALFVEVGDYVRAGEELARVASPTTVAASPHRGRLASLMGAFSRRARPAHAPAVFGVTGVPIVPAVAPSDWIPWLSDMPAIDAGPFRRTGA